MRRLRWPLALVVAFALGLTAVVLAAGLIVFYRYEKEFVFHLS